MTHWNGQTWTAEPSPVTTSLLRVWGSGPNDVWAVGSNGVILHRTTGNFVQVPSGTTEFLLDIDGSDATHVWVLGSERTILRWNGQSWNATNTGALGGSDTGGALRVFPNDDVFVFGLKGTVIRWDGEAWIRSNLGPFDGMIYAAHGRSADDLWMVGRLGTIFHLDGQRFTKHFSSRTVRDLSVIASTAANDVWYVRVPDAVRWDGAGLVAPFGALAGASGMFFLDANERWAVGQYPQRWNGTSWVTPSFYSNTFPSPHPIWGGAANDIWMSDSYLVHWNGATWTRMATVGDPTESGRSLAPRPTTSGRSGASETSGTTAARAGCARRYPSATSRRP